jgi:hypothetical protein
MSFFILKKRGIIMNGERILFSLIFFAIVYAGVFFVYYMIFDDMLKKEKYTKISELVLLTNKFKLDQKKMDYRKCLRGVALINAFILALVVVIVEWIGIDTFLWLPIALVLLFGLILLCYYLYGKYCEKKWGK